MSKIRRVAGPAPSCGSIPVTSTQSVLKCRTGRRASPSALSKDGWLPHESFRTPASPLKALDAVAETFESLSRPYAAERLEGLGVSVRGIVNSETGVLEVGSNASWNGLAVRRHLQQRLRIPVYVENNIRSAALVEYSLGVPEAHASHSLLYVMVGEGVGMGIVLGGQLYRGPHNAAGEFGQMVITDSPGDGRQDRTGLPGVTRFQPGHL